MTVEELRQARIELGFNKTQMAKRLKTPRPTYRDWEAGINPIPGVCDVAVEGLLYRDRVFMDRIKNRCTDKK
jgi:Helix-turn-helix.